MNGVDPIAPQEQPAAVPPVPGPLWRLLWRVLAVELAVGMVPALLLTAAGRGGFHGWPSLSAALAELRWSGVASVPLAASLLAVAGLAGTLAMAVARRGHAGPRSFTAPRFRGRVPLSALGRHLATPGRAARWPQAVLVGALAALAAAVAWRFLPLPGALLAPPEVAFVLGGAAILLGFPLLIAERAAAPLARDALPEAPALHALLLLPALAWPLAGALQIGAGLGFSAAPRIGQAVAVVLAATGAELLLRALGRLFLPPPPDAVARAAIGSVLAGAVAAGGSGRLSVAGRRHLGLDFSRSWALSFVAAAALPVCLLLLLLGWGATCLVPLALDQRAIYERLGRPVAVLHPGLHAILPWPLGRVRLVEYGQVHELPLGASPPARAAAAEDPAPASSDRLWEQAHPGELTFLIASEAAGRQNFQAVNADLRIEWRVGLGDADAEADAYRLAGPDAAVRAAAGRVATRFFAGRTLDGVLGANRERMAAALRETLAHDLAGLGIEVVAVVIEAIHPPAGAAAAYHAVQAAAVDADASIAAERGRALAAASAARQYATGIVTQAEAGAAEATAAASAARISFAADAAASEAGPSFLLERYFAALSAGLRGAPLTILDSRIAGPDAPVLDLRPPAAANAPGAGPGME